MNNHVSDKKKASMVSRIASTCGLLYICANLVFIAATIVGPISSVINASIFILSFILIPLLGLAGIVLGIVALCTLTPEEKQEKMSTSGTTKNQALVGIIVPPVMFVVFGILNFALRAMIS